jgi:hypothetical protein
MSQYHLFLFTIFGFLLYFVVTDSSAAAFVDLIFRLGRFEYEKRKWWLLHNPSNIFVRWLIHRRSMKMAKELMKEFAEKENK